MNNGWQKSMDRDIIILSRKISLKSTLNLKRNFLNFMKFLSFVVQPLHFGSIKKSFLKTSDSMSNPFHLPLGISLTLSNQLAFQAPKIIGGCFHLNSNGHPVPIYKLEALMAKWLIYSFTTLSIPTKSIHLNQKEKIYGLSSVNKFLCRMLHL